jgi:hypothetical protein
MREDSVTSSAEPTRAVESLESFFAIAIKIYNIHVAAWQARPREEMK